MKLWQGHLHMQWYCMWLGRLNWYSRLSFSSHLRSGSKKIINK